MPVLVQTCGPEWMIIQHILPQHVGIYNHAASASYLIRITILQAHAATAAACEDSDALWNDVVLQILRGIVDKVPNVRMVVALGLAKIVEAAGGDHQAVVEAHIIPAWKNDWPKKKIWIVGQLVPWPWKRAVNKVAHDMTKA
jgi:hypothetical protein